MTVLALRHGDGPQDDRITSWCQLNKVPLDIRRPFKGDALPDLTQISALVVYGGMYNADAIQEHPFLSTEYAAIEQALARDIPLLGICQGAQMLARALGAWAGAPDHGRHEFGYYEVAPTDDNTALLPTPLHLCQAHFHTYDLPRGAVHLARSTSFEQQAFRYGARAYGFQFHAEVTIEGFRRWQQRALSYGQPGAQTRDAQDRLMVQHDRAQADWFYAFLDKFLGELAA